MHKYLLLDQFLKKLDVFTQNFPVHTKTLPPPLASHKKTKEITTF